MVGSCLVASWEAYCPNSNWLQRNSLRLHSKQRKKNGIGRGGELLADHLESGRTNAHRQSIVEVLYRFGFPF